MTTRISLISLITAFLIILFTGTVYYPRFEKTKGEATISFDVSGYYMYLPAHFIYNDLKKCSFQDEILKKYKMSSSFHQAFLHDESGNYVMKYAIGQSIHFAPFFFIAHYYATHSDKYESDGFSYPYQLSISIGSLLIALLGLLVLRLVLLQYFSDRVVAISILLLVLGSNYLNYSAIDGAMTHNSLFTIYSLILYFTIKFYKAPSYKYSLILGALIGLATLIRPTEIISFLIPILWNVRLISYKEITNRFSLLKSKSNLLLVSFLVCFSIVFIQLLYWKYASGDWIVYSYQEQGFSWLSPHIKECLFSYKSGWLSYSPLMVFSLIGYYFLLKRKENNFGTLLLFMLLFMYINFSWDI